MVTYDEVMAPPVDLPIEAPDVTANELHVRVLHRLSGVLQVLFRDKALVLGDIFVRVDGIEQASPDVLIVHGPEPGDRPVYHVPPEPVPDVTLEVLSPANRLGKGRRLLQQKRELFGRIGVPLHIELDPKRGFLTIWRNVGGTLVAEAPVDRFDGDELGGLRIELAPGDVRLVRPDGREFTDVADEIDRADREERRADREKRRADLETQRADRLAEKLRAAGIDTDAD
jgi:hypothetical protein